MASSLAKELLKLQRPAPESVDPEEDGLYDAEHGGRSSLGGSAVEEEDRGPSKVKPEGRKLRSADVVLANDPKYAGRAVSRADAFASSSEEEDEDEDEDEDVEEVDDDDEEEEEEAENSEEDSMDIQDDASSNSMSEEESGADDNDEDARPSSGKKRRRPVERETQDQFEESESEDDDEDDGEERVVVRGSKRARQNPEHVKNQVSLWSELVGFRIRMQGLLTAAEKLPRDRDHAAFSKANPKIQKSVEANTKKIGDVLENLLELRALTSKHYIAEKDLQEISLPSGDTDAAWASISKTNKVMESMYMKTFDTWHRETIAKANGGMKLKAINKTISDQLNMVMEGGAKIIQRAQMRPAANAPIALEPEEESQDTAETVHDEEVYNDTSFYQQLLVSFVSASNVREMGRVADVDDDLVRDRVRRKMKSAGPKRRFFRGKDRIIDYKVHEKLVNFVTPCPPVNTPIETEQLFLSLFQN